MARAFTIAFDFKGKTYLALASIAKGNSDDTSFSVRLYDDSLSRIIPGGCIQYCPREVEEKQGYALADQLLRCIDDSVRSHLQLAGF